MLTYGLLLSIVLVASLVATRGGGRSEPRLVPVFVAIFALVLVAGLRDGTGTDSRLYERWYVAVLPFEPLGQAKDPGFSALGHGIRALFGSTPAWMFLVVALLTTAPTVLTLRKYARPFALSMTLYVLTGVYFYGFNGMRQALAGAIVLAGSKFLFERRWKIFLPIVALASLFHSSALILVPIYFAVTTPLVSFRSVAAVGALGGVVLFYGPIVGLFSAVAGEGRYGAYSEALGEEGHGANVLRLAVRVAIVAVALVRWRQLRQLLPESAPILLNLAIVTAVLYAIALQHWIYARAAFYPGMYDLFLLPAIAQSFGRSDRRIIQVAMFACFLAYSVALLLSGESRLLPYRSVLG